MNLYALQSFRYKFLWFKPAAALVGGVLFVSHFIHLNVLYHSFLRLSRSSFKILRKYKFYHRDQGKNSDPNLDQEESMVQHTFWCFIDGQSVDLLLPLNQDWDWDWHWEKSPELFQDSDISLALLIIIFINHHRDQTLRKPKGPRIVSQVDLAHSCDQEHDHNWNFGSDPHLSQDDLPKPLIEKDRASG